MELASLKLEVRILIIIECPLLDPFDMQFKLLSFLSIAAIGWHELGYLRLVIKGKSKTFLRKSDEITSLVKPSTNAMGPTAVFLFLFFVS